MLTKHEEDRISQGPVLGTGPVVRYKVGALPPGEEAALANFNGKWKILRVRNGVQGQWAGEYQSADDALAALQAEV